MGKYSIKDLEHLSGIKAHTLRIWEQRYSFIKPKRTETNIRFYDDHDLKLVLNIALLKEAGFKISKIAEMDEERMNEEVLSLTEKNLRYPEQIHALTLAMVDFNEDRFEKIMATNILQLGFESTMLNIVYPFLSKIGVMWQTGSINPAQEHFITNLIRQKLIVAIDGQFHTVAEAAQKFMLFLPEGEWHEISLLFSSFLIQSRGNKVVYLGQSLPFSDLLAVYNVHKPQYMLTILTTKPDSYQNAEEYIAKLSNAFPETTILLSGLQIIAQDIEPPQNVLIFNNFSELSDFVEEVARSVTQEA